MRADLTAALRIFSSTSAPFETRLTQPSAIRFLVLANADGSAFLSTASKLCALSRLAFAQARERST